MTITPVRPVPLVRTPYAFTAAPPTASPDSIQIDGAADAAPVESRSIRRSLGHAAMVLALAVPTLVGCMAAMPTAAVATTVSTTTRDTVSVTQDNVQLVTDDDQTLTRAQSMIQNATQSVRFETTSLSGVQGETIARALADKQQEPGKTVQVLVDAQSFQKDANNRIWVDFLRQNNVDVRFSSGRDANNMLIVDLNQAIVGGSSFTSAINHNANVVIQGPGVADLRTQWDSGWLAAGGSKDSEVPPPVDPTNPPPAANARVRVLNAAQTRDRILNLIANSRHDIQIETHGLDDPQIIQALQAAHSRGVQVNVMLNHSVGPFADVNNLKAAMAFADPMSTQIPLRWYQAPSTDPTAPTPMLNGLNGHVAIFDGADLIVGSTDLTSDAQSSRSVSLETDGTAVIAPLNLQFIQDWQYHGIDNRVMSPDGLWNGTTPVPGNNPASPLGGTPSPTVL